MALRYTIYILFSSIFFGCNSSTQKKETFIVDGDTITMKTETIKDTLSDNYTLADLTPQLTTHINDRLKEADSLIIKYNGQLSKEKYDANILDEVLDKWRNSNEKTKEKPAYVVEALGAAFGEDIVATLNCEWKVLTENQGTDLTVIHKKYKINVYPFSSVEKAYTQNRTGSLLSIKLVMKKHIQDADNGEDDGKR